MLVGSSESFKNRTYFRLNLLSLQGAREEMVFGVENEFETARSGDLHTTEVLPWSRLMSNK